MLLSEGARGIEKVRFNKKTFWAAAAVLVLCGLCVYFFLGRRAAEFELRKTHDVLAAQVAYNMQRNYPPDYDAFCALLEDPGGDAGAYGAFRGKSKIIKQQLEDLCGMAGGFTTSSLEVMHLYETLAEALQRTGPTEELESAFQECQEYFDLLFYWTREPGDVTSPTAEELVGRTRAVEELYGKTGAEVSARVEALYEQTDPTAWKGPATGSDLYVMPTPGVYPSSGSDLQILE